MNLGGVVFITLKLIGIEPVAGWSWWLTFPLWGGFLMAGFCIYLAAKR